MAKTKRSYPSKTRAFTMTDEVYQNLQDIANSDYDGNLSMAIRMMVKRWHEERAAKQAQGTK